MVGTGILQAEIIGELSESRRYLCSLKSIAQKFNAIMQVKLPLPDFQVPLFGDPLDSLCEHVIHHDLVLPVSGMHLESHKDASALPGSIVGCDLIFELPLLLCPPSRVLQVCHGPSGQPPPVLHLGASRLPCLLFSHLGMAGEGGECLVGQQVHLVRVDGGFLGAQVPGFAGFCQPKAEEGTAEPFAFMEAVTEGGEMLKLQGDVQLMQPHRKVLSEESVPVYLHGLLIIGLDLPAPLTHPRPHPHLAPEHRPLPVLPHPVLRPLHSHLLAHPVPCALHGITRALPVSHVDYLSEHALPPGVSVQPAQTEAEDLLISCLPQRSQGAGPKPEGAEGDGQEMLPKQDVR
jgi:hypothetical protein